MVQLQKQKPICAECKSDDIEAHAQVAWSDDVQDWQIVEVLNKCNCANCGNTYAQMEFINLAPMKTYAIFDLNGCLAFLDRATSKQDALNQLIFQDESYASLAVDDYRIHELDEKEAVLMWQWQEDGQATHEWLFDWRAPN